MRQFQTIPLQCCGFSTTKDIYALRDIHYNSSFMKVESMITIFVSIYLNIAFHSFKGIDLTERHIESSKSEKNKQFLITSLNLMRNGS